MRQEKFKVADNNEFVRRLNECLTSFEAKRHIMPVNQFVFDTINKLRKCIVSDELSKCRGIGFGFYRTMCDMEGGDDFLYSEEGRQLMSLLNYFDEIYYPSHFTKK